MAVTDYQQPNVKKQTYAKSPTNERYDTLEDLVLKTHQAANLPTPTSSTLPLKVSAWLEVLEPVPTEHIRASYRRALDRHEGQYALTAYEVLAGWQEHKQELLRYPEQRPEPAGYLSGGQPEPIYNLDPAIAELRRWSLKLGWALDDGAGLVKRSDGLLIRYTLAVKLHYGFSVSDTVEWIRDMGEMTYEHKGDFDALLLTLHATEKEPARRAEAVRCVACQDRYFVRDNRLGSGNLPAPIMPCPECA